MNLRLFLVTLLASSIILAYLIRWLFSRAERWSFGLSFFKDKKEKTVSWIILGAIAIAGIIYGTWGSPYGTTQFLRLFLIALIIHEVSRNILVERRTANGEKAEKKA